eukprot:6748285-Lingulodinium_polyedra.AAC.1
MVSERWRGVSSRVASFGRRGRLPSVARLAPFVRRAPPRCALSASGQRFPKRAPVGPFSAGLL